MSTIQNTDAFVEAVEDELSTRDDTLYISEADYQSLRRWASNKAGELKSPAIDTVRLLDLEIVVTPVPVPIVCQRGDVFPLAKDWKNGDVTH